MITVQARIQNVRSRGKTGGAIVAATNENQDKYVFVLSNQLLPDSNDIDRGQIWKVCGPSKTFKLRNDFGVINEEQIQAQKAEMILPSGDNIIHFISENKQIEGIGYVKARKLHEQFGDDLVTIIEGNQIDLLTHIISPKSANLLCDVFAKNKLLRTLQWLDQEGVELSVAQKVSKFYGNRTQLFIEDNPYRLLSFCSKWKIVDQLATKKFGIQESDPRRLTGAVQESLYKAFKNGSTAQSANELKKHLYSLFSSSKINRSSDPNGSVLQAMEPSELVDKALNLGAREGLYYIKDDLYLAAGIWEIEKKIAQFISSKSKSLKPAKNNFSRVLSSFQKEEGYLLTAEQANAVITSANNSFSLIIGGAGTGKTTVLKCLYNVIQSSNPDATIHQLALSGKAALRMTQASGKKSLTIASFLRDIKPEELPKGVWIVIDEASMTDVLSFFRVITKLPENCNVVLVGDDYQLPPVGPGLVLHALVNNPRIPQTRLKVVKRQSDESGIPLVASSIRNGNWPTLSSDLSSGVSFIPCDPFDLSSKSIEVLQFLGPSNTQIISATRGGHGGCNQINKLCQSTNPEKFITYMDEEYGEIEFLNSTSGFKVNDPVMFTRNDYNRGLRNGSIGVIKSTRKSKSIGDYVCEVEFDTGTIDLDADDLEDLQLAYAITIHKSQGSQFNNVIVPVRNNILLDLTLLYTAVTRAVHKVVLIGDENAAKSAITKIASDKRLIGLSSFLASNKSI
tara:strand:- start:962 stop:3172 length:2211 start_codon:yes stop_codon:yes gene_type:complete